MSDQPSQLDALGTLRDATSDPALRAALDAAIATMEQAQTRQTTVQDQSQTGVVNQGDVRGSLFTGETHGNTIAEVVHIYQQTTTTPQVDYGAALRRYLEHLYSRHATIDLRGIDDRPMDMPLSDLYVSLSLHEPPPEDLRGRGGLRGFIEKVRGWFGQGEAADEDDTEQDDAAMLVRGSVAAEPVDWSQALRHPRIAVIGAPGSGKTTLLQFTTVRLAEILARDEHTRLADLGLDDETPDQPSRPPVPLLLPLRDLGRYLSECQRRDDLGANPRLLLECLIHTYNGFDLNLPDDFFSRLCDTGRAILLLDGLDEVTRSEDRVFVSSIVREFALRYPGCRYVLTARVAAYHGDAQIGAGFRICTVADMSEAQQRQFIANWSRSLHRLVFKLSGEMLQRDAERYADEFWTALQANERVRSLATNPLLLTVVAVIFYNKYQLPEDRASLYEECVEVLLRGGRGKADRAGQERMQYGGRPDLRLGLNQRRELLAALAYQMHQRGQRGLFIERGDLVWLVADHLRTRHPEADDAARAFVDELPVHIGLLDEREPDRFRFSHLSFQEFLAARYVAETDQWDDLLAHHQESWWREVILLCAGHLSTERCWKFLGRLIEQGTTPAERAAVLELAAAALAELERFKGQGPLTAEIRQRALKILAAPPADAPAAVRVVCGRVLGQVGDPRPGVCSLPPAMVAVSGGRLVMGISREEAERVGLAWERYWLEKDRKDVAERARTWPQNEINQQPITIATFELARYPVTNAQYKRFIDDGGYDNPHASWWDEAGRTWLLRDDHATEGLTQWQQRQHKQHPEWWHDKRLGIARPNHPVVGISWYEAMAFCRWLTQHQEYNRDKFVYYLPSEAEWEYAARRDTGRTYPWGNEEPDKEWANFEQHYGGTTAVGCFPLGATADGIYDLAGNVWEWTRSVYQPYPYNPNDGREDTNNPAKKHFTLRGGGWGDGSFLMRASLRNLHSPVNHVNYVGFRLARHLAA